MATERTRFIQGLVDSCVQFLHVLCDVELYSYQIEIVDRLFFSLLIGDAEEITVETARQVGKSECLADLMATAMVIFPKLAAAFPEDPNIKKFRTGVLVGCFAPTDDQAETIFSRVQQRLTSEHARQVLSDPEINEEAHVSGNTITLKSGSLCRRQTANAKARIESKTYHLITVDEAQDADSETVRRRIQPTATAVGGSIAKIGTPGANKCDYYEAIVRNKRRGKTHGKKNHFAYNWRRAAAENPYYRQAIKKEIARLGEESDEFMMAYNLKWLLERGMFITDELIDELADPTMPLISSYTMSPVVIGIDVARKHDSTVVTAVWVDWDHPDEFGLYRHRILDWLELHGEEWESQYRMICEFVGRYRVARLGVDAQGMGGPVAERLQVLLPGIEVEALSMNPPDQSERWTHLMQLLQRRLIGWPGSYAAKQSREWKRFAAQMSEVEKEYKGKYLNVHAPDSDNNAHDDYPDSLALACSLTRDFGQDLEVEVWDNNPLLERSGGRSALLTGRS